MNLLARTLAVLFLLAAFAAPLPAAAGPGAVSFVPAWAPRDTAVYEITKSKTVKGTIRSATTTVTVAVVGKTADGYRFEWRCDDLRPDASLPDNHKKTLVSLVKGMKIAYTTDKNGVYQNIVNLDEVRAWLQALVTQVIAAVPGGQHQDAARKLLGSMLANDAIIKSADSDILILHNPYFAGQAFDADEPYSGEVVLPNVFDSSRPFTGSIVLVAKNAGGFRQMTIRQEIDKEKSAALINDIFRKMAAAMGKSLPDDQSFIDSIAVTDIMQYTYAETGNWPDRISHTRTIKIAGEIREEKVEFVRRR